MDCLPAKDHVSEWCVTRIYNNNTNKYSKHRWFNKYYKYSKHRRFKTASLNDIVERLFESFFFPVISYVLLNFVVLYTLLFSR